MMKKFNFFGLLALLCLAISCKVQVPMNTEYFSKPSRVGLLVNVNPPKKYRAGSQGLLDLAVTSGDKYQPMLDLADKQLNPSNNLTIMIKDLLQSKGKEVVMINEKFDATSAQKFSGEKSQGKKYSNYDFRYLKEKYNIDELQFISMDWGVLISYYSMIEIGRNGYAYIDNRIVNLTDNSLYFANDNAKVSPIKGKWNTPPSYEVGLKSIQDALAQALDSEKALYSK